MLSVLIECQRRVAVHCSSVNSEIRADALFTSDVSGRRFRSPPFSSQLTGRPQALPTS